MTYSVPSASSGLESEIPKHPLVLGRQSTILSDTRLYVLAYAIEIDNFLKLSEHYHRHDPGKGGSLR